MKQPAENLENSCGNEEKWKKETKEETNKPKENRKEKKKTNKNKERT